MITAEWWVKGCYCPGDTLESQAVRSHWCEGYSGCPGRRSSWCDLEGDCPLPSTDIVESAVKCLTRVVRSGQCFYCRSECMQDCMLELL